MSANCQAVSTSIMSRFNLEWDLVSMTARRTVAYYDSTMTSWVDIYYDLLIKRKPTYYLLTFLLPCFIITSISIVGMFAPFSDAGDREEKVTMGLTTLLTMAVFLTIIADKMPKSSDGLPLLGKQKKSRPRAIISILFRLQ